MSGYIDLALSDEEQQKQYASNTVMAEQPKYPYCTTFQLDERTLDEIDHADWEVGDLFHFHVMAKITGINSNESADGNKKCVTFQMTAIKGESESAEDSEDEEHEFEDGSRLASEGGYLKYVGS